MNPFKRKNTEQTVQSVVLDTSGIIDGRILEIARAGFVPQNVVVPQFVIAELQFLADHGDTQKRERARYGLDVIRELQDIKKIDVSISREKFERIKEVDDKLVALAKRYGALLYTTDFNLNKVAQIEGVTVLNVNELAHALRPNLLPGERVSIKLTQIGQDKTQGVGYLSDGTMVVVEQASRYVGHQVQAVCTRILQTQAGKMMFATLANAPALPAKQHDAPALAVQQKQHEPQPAQKLAQQPKKPVRAAHFQPKKHQPHHSEHQGQHPHQTHQHKPQPPKQPEQPQHAPAAHNPNANNAPKPVKQQGQAQPKQTPKRQQYGNQPKQAQQQNAGQQNANQGSNQQHPKQQQPRRQHGRKRVSPEDSLIATLKEMHK